MPSTAPRRAAVITTSWPRHEGDAAGHFVLAEVEELLGSNWDVTVLAPGTSPYEPPRCRVLSLGGDELFAWPGALPRLRQEPGRIVVAAEVVLRARRTLRHLGPFDRLVTHWLVPSTWPVLLGPLSGQLLPARNTPPLLTPEGTIEAVAHGSDVRLLLRFPRLLRNHILRQLCDPKVHLRFVSRALRDELLDAPELPAGLRAELRSRSSVRPAALRVPPLPSRLQARGQLGVRSESWLILIVGRLIPEKRVDLAIRAAALVPHGRIVVVGSGPELESLRAQFPDAEFLGQLPRLDVLLWMRAADVVVSTSRLEGAPTVVREARALNVPVVACEAGDLTEWAQSDPDLWIVGA